MRRISFAVALIFTLPSFADERFIDIGRAVEAAIARGDCPGAVVGVLHKGEVVYKQAFGKRAVEPAPEPMTADTIFDLASLTKPIATSTSVMKLIEDGKLRLDAKV